MPTNNVDLTAVLPVLDEAVKPFDDLLAYYDAMPFAARPSAITPLRNALAFPISLGDLRKLMEAVDAVRRVAEEKV